jgi:hypothetical protein
MAGRRSIDETNKIRASLGLSVIPKAKKKSTAILPNEKKARAQEILSEMLTKKSKAIVQRIMDKALNDDDEDQMACLKLCVDRMIPVSYFEKEKSGNKGVTIQIVGVGQTTIQEDEDVIDGEVIDG